MPLCFVRAVLSQPCLSFAKNLVNNEYKENLFVKKGESLSSKYIYITNNNNNKLKHSSLFDSIKFRLPGVQSW